MKPLLLAVFATLFTVALPAALVPCPKYCKCDYKNDSLKAMCSSLKFLAKIDDKQADAVHSLDLSSNNIVTLDKRLKKLRNLRQLDLSNNELKDLEHFPVLPKLTKLSLANNKLKDMTFSQLPKSITDLNMSQNLIENLPKDWLYLHHLSSFHISNNPINCDETAINKYVSLIQHKINITDKVICHSPKNSKGKKLQTLIAEALLNPMMGDQEELRENDEDVDNTEFIKHTTTENSEKENKDLNDDLFEGSGSEEGSGDSDKENLSPCILDCTTLKPLEILKENNGSPIQSIKEQVGILFEDLFGKEEEVPTTSPEPSTEKSSTPVVETISKKTITATMQEPNTANKTERLVIGASKDNDLEKASLGSGEDSHTYYLIATVIILMIIVAIFILIKKRSSQGKMNRRRNSTAENGVCEEMKPLGKYKEISNGTHNDKQKEDDFRPERIPLMNGQNGKSDVPSNKGSLEDLDVTLRTPSENNVSPLKPERVTVTASEIPPNVLKTPQLVHRQLTSDGEIITKPLDDSY